jgi:hypothetical protein
MSRKESQRQRILSVNPLVSRDRVIQFTYRHVPHHPGCPRLTRQRKGYSKRHSDKSETSLLHVLARVREILVNEGRLPLRISIVPRLHTCSTQRLRWYCCRLSLTASLRSPSIRPTRDLLVGRPESNAFLSSLMVAAFHDADDMTFCKAMSTMTSRSIITGDWVTHRTLNQPSVSRSNTAITVKMRCEFAKRRLCST